jgi:hypothetical protein
MDDLVPPVREVHTRFLYPFFFDQWKLEEADQILQSAKFLRTGGSSQTLWDCNVSPGLYTDEVLEHVKGFLFSKDSSTCRYFKLNGNVQNAIFHHRVELLLSNKKLVTLRLAKVGIELFLMNYGIGMLSIALTPEIEDPTLDEVVDFNYKIARYDPMPAVSLRIPHPDDQPDLAERLRQQQDVHLPERPVAGAPVSERLGLPGGVFKIQELIDVVLQPLHSFGLRKVQQGLAAYSVVRFGSQVDLAKEQTRASLNRFISALAQIEEPGHAGAVAGCAPVTNEVLNSKHWTAVGLLGAVHLIADQDPTDGTSEHPFNEQRVPRVRDKYFIPYLMAIFQRLFLERTIRESGAYLEMSRNRSSRHTVRVVKSDIASAFLSTTEGLFSELDKASAASLAERLEMALTEAATAVFEKHRRSQMTARTSADFLRFLEEDLGRTIVDATDAVIHLNGGTSKRQMKRRAVRCVSDAVANLFSQDRHVARLREEILEFAVQGHFVQVSSREVLHRFYRVAQKGLDVPEAWAEVNYALSNLDRKLATEREHRVAKTAAENLAVISRVQKTVSLLEYLVIAAYAVEVFHIAIQLKDHHGWSGVQWGLVALLAGLLIVYLLEFAERRLKHD